MRVYSSHKRLFLWCNPHQTLPYLCRFTLDITFIIKKKKKSKQLKFWILCVHSETQICIPAEPVYWAKKERKTFWKVFWGDEVKLSFNMEPYYPSEPSRPQRTEAVFFCPHEGGKQFVIEELFGMTRDWDISLLNVIIALNRKWVQRESGKLCDRETNFLFVFQRWTLRNPLNLYRIRSVEWGHV